MMEIKLPNGMNAVIDDSDFKELANFKWIAHKSGPKVYVGRRESGKLILMHRQILEAEPGVCVDHINGNGLDNRRCNIRLCTHCENMKNRSPSKNGTSKYLGVYIEYHGGTRDPSIRAQIASNKKRYRLGYFKTEEDAARAYDEAAKKYHGEFANLNFK